MLLFCLALSNKVQELRSDCELLDVSGLIVFLSVCSAVTLGQYSLSSPGKWNIFGGDGMQVEGSVLLGPLQKKLFTEEKKKKCVLSSTHLQHSICL